MPKLSSFNPCGLLRMSSKPSYAKSIYDALIDGEKDAFDNTQGSPREAGNYARAMGFARIRCALERAGRQIEPANCNDLLPDFEQRFGLVPGAYDTLQQRQDALAVKMQYFLGAARSNVVAVLRRLIGTDFLALRTLGPAEYVSLPSNPATGVTHCTDIRIAPKFLQLTDPIGALGTPLWASYANLDTTAGETKLVIGEKVVVQAGHSAQQEKCVVTGVRGSGDTRQFQTTFTKAHDIGAAVTTMDYPYEWSTYRFALIVVASRVARDAVKRAKLDDAMRGMSRATDTWAIVEPTFQGALTVGPLTVGSSMIGTTTIGQVAFTLEP